MAIFIVLAFIAVPIAEISLFIEVGGRIGVFNTLAIVVLTAIAGTWLLRAQGLSTLRRAQESLARQEFPAREVFDGMCLLVAGALLLTPGFLTDVLGFLLFLPPLRAVLRGFIWRRLSASGTIWIDGEMEINPQSRRGPRPGDGGPTIDGDFREIPPDRKGDGDETP